MTDPARFTVADDPAGWPALSYRPAWDRYFTPVVDRATMESIVAVVNAGHETPRMRFLESGGVQVAEYDEPFADYDPVVKQAPDGSYAVGLLDWAFVGIDTDEVRVATTAQMKAIVERLNAEIAAAGDEVGPVALYRWHEAPQTPGVQVIAPDTTSTAILPWPNGTYRFTIDRTLLAQA